MSDQTTTQVTGRERRTAGASRPLRRALHALLVLALLPITAVAVLTGVATPASAAGAVSPAVNAANGFPQWYQDAAGNRVQQCLDPNDPDCLVLAGPTFDTAAPVVFPTNFPDEFFYTVADSEIVDTPGCLGTAPGKASVRLALEGAFINGVPAAADRMVFGRIRVKVTSGLCPNTTYKFRHPFGVETFTTNGAGAVPANVGTEDVGCVPTPGVPCNFNAATASRVFGSAGAGGFLRWDPAVAPAANPGSLGDGAVLLHPVVGGTVGNDFRILDSAGNDTVGIGTNLFAVAGKLAGSLVATPNPADFGGVALGSSKSANVVVSNVDSVPVTLTSLASNSAEFAVSGGDCAVGTVLNRDQTCTVGITFSPAGLAGRRSASLTIASSGGIRSPLTVDVTGAGTNVGDAPTVSLSSPTLAFGNVRVRETSPVQHLVVTNTGAAPLEISSVSFDPNTVPEPDHYRILGDTCASGLSIDPTKTCTIDVEFAPTVRGPHDTALLISSNTNAGLDRVTITGTGTGGVAARSPAIDPTNGFPEWYRDEGGLKVSQCVDPADPNCIVLGDQFFDPAQPISFPTNYPSEFFYTVATSDNVAVNDPTCGTAAVGKAFARTAVEGAFTNGAPVPGDQMVFGRIRFSVTTGLCPDSEYVFRSPYGDDHFVTDASGSLKRAAGTNDVGCAPLATVPCDFDLALSSRVLGGFVRWDPAVAPAAPAGYLGDAATLHPIVGAPYSSDGVTPNNFFEITRADDGTVIGHTDLWTVMGKLRGPLESDQAAVNLGGVPVGSTSGTQTVTLTNTGVAIPGVSDGSLTVSSVGIAGADPGDFTAAGAGCVGTTLAVGASCTVSVSFSPTATGNRSAQLEVVHTGVNTPVVIPLSGVGGVTGSVAAISFNPRSVTYAPLHVGRSSEVETVTVSNAGGNLDLTVFDATVAGTNAADFAIVDNRCAVDGVPVNVAPGASCQIDVVFSPQAGSGARSATLTLTDNAPGGTHTVALTGTSSTATAIASATTDSRHGFPQWYQDSSGTRVEPCLDAGSGHCVLLADAGYNPANPLVFPTNFPTEFFYSLADTPLIATPGCPGISGPGTAQLRLALEGSFATGSPANGQQITFGRVRVKVSAGGLCPSAPYSFITPYGPFTFTTGTDGGTGANGATINIGGGALDFATAIGSPVADSFLRDNPNVAPAAPAGYLGAGNGTAFHKVVGGTYRPANANGPTNVFAIADLAGNELARTDQFAVAAKVAGPLLADAYTVDFGHVPAGTTSGARTVNVTNVGVGATLSAIEIVGTNPGDFQVVTGANAGTCATGGALAADATCSVKVLFAPASTGVKSATLRVTPSTGAPLLVALKGAGDPPLAPVASVQPGVLAYGTRTGGTTTTLSATVTNTGNANLVVGAPSITGATADYKVTANTCATVIPGASCAISVSFSPTAQGSRTGSLVIPHNATGGSTTVSLTGTGTGSTFTTGDIKFGTVALNTSKNQTVTVKNSGTINITFPTVANGFITFGGTTPAAFSYVSGCAGTTVAPGKTCTLTLSFRPTAAVNYSATYTVKGDVTSLPKTVTASLTGTGK